MIYCTKCGKQIREDADFCPYCGNKVFHSNNQAEVSSEYNADNRRKTSRMLIPGIITAFLIVCIGLGYFFRDYALNRYYMYQSNKAPTVESKLSYNIDAIKAKYTDESMSNLKNILMSNADGEKNLSVYIDKLKSLVPKNEYNNIEVSYYTQRSDHYYKNKKYEDALYYLVKAHNSGYPISSNKNYESLMTNIACKISGAQSGQTRKQLNQAGIEYGDLDNDGVDEIVVLTKKMDDEYLGHQLVSAYKYSNGAYTLIDKQDCEYVESVVDVSIKAANSKQKMIFLTGCAGAHAGYSVNYILQDGKLTAVSEPVYSLYPIEPKDVDNDGYFEIPSESVDPASVDQSNAGSDKIITWYKINGVNDLVIAKQESIKAGN